MKLHTEPFPIGMVEGKSVLISDDLCNQMIKPHNPEIDMWTMLIEKYQ
jgi:hypothetical protein